MNSYFKSVLFFITLILSLSFISTSIHAAEDDGIEFNVHFRLKNICIDITRVKIKCAIFQSYGNAAVWGKSETDSLPLNNGNLDTWRKIMVKINPGKKITDVGFYKCILKGLHKNKWSEFSQIKGYDHECVKGGPSGYEVSQQGTITW